MGLISFTDSGALMISHHLDRRILQAWGIPSYAPAPQSPHRGGRGCSRIFPGEYYPVKTMGGLCIPTAKCSLPCDSARLRIEGHSRPVLEDPPLKVNECNRLISSTGRSIGSQKRCGRGISRCNADDL